MRILKINKENIKREETRLIGKYLRQGKVVVLPTDTVYGLSCLATSKKGIEKIHSIKKSDPLKPLIVLLNSYKMLKEYAIVSNKQLQCLRSIWGKLAKKNDFKLEKENKIPVTVVLDKKYKVLKFATAGHESIAVRLPKDEINDKIIREVGLPLVSTSLNVSGKGLLTSVDTIEKDFKVKPDLVVDIGRIKKVKPSRLIDIRDINNIKILRN